MKKKCVITLISIFFLGLPLLLREENDAPLIVSTAQQKLGGYLDFFLLGNVRAKTTLLPPRVSLKFDAPRNLICMVQMAVDKVIILFKIILGYVHGLCVPSVCWLTSATRNFLSCRSKSITLPNTVTL